MKQGRALPEVLKELQHQNNMKQDFIGPAHRSGAGVHVRA